MNEDIVVAAVAENSDRINEQRRKMRLLRDETDPFQMPKKKFMKLYRLPPECVLEIINHLDSEELRSGTIPKHLKVLSTLHFIAQGSYQAAVGKDCSLGLSQPTVARCISIVTKLTIEKMTPSHIKFPTSPGEKQKVQDDFLHLYGMPNTLGAVDGSHIGIATPPINHPTAPGNLFYNRKGFYSINCQMICDARGRVISVNPNYPGSTHDSAVWKSSQVHRYLERQYVEGQHNQWLLGDKGYPLLPWLMTPHPASTPGSAEERYNICHKKSRNIIEMTFGRLKNKFRCLLRHRILHYSPEKAADIIVTCCTLYNTFIDVWTDDENENQDANDDRDDGTETAFQENYLQEAQLVQENLINSYFTH